MSFLDKYNNGQTLLVDKDLDWTSFDVVKKIRNTLRSALQLKKIKVGHAGTLDPLADGLLIVCTGKFTKRINEFQAQEKEYKHFDYLLVFLAGLINDTVVGLPLGISSLSYVLICIATSSFRNITIRPSPIKDWFYFLFIISLINSLNYSVLSLFFSYNLVLTSYLVNTTCTFLLYIIFVSIFKYYMKGIND